MTNGNGRNDQDFSSYILPAIIGLLVVAAVGYYFMKVRHRHEEVAVPVAAAPVVPAPVTVPK